MVYIYIINPINNMKKIFAILLFTFSITICYSQKITFKDILNSLNSALNSNTIRPQNVFIKEYVVNSSSKGNLFGGHNKIVEQIVLPQNTVKWYYRITIIEKNSNYQYPNNETLFYCIHNGIQPKNFVNLRVPFNIFVINSSGDSYNFLEGKPFNTLRDYCVYNTDSYIGQCPLVTGNIWIGIQNASTLTGAKAIIEVVAMVREG